MWNSWIWRADCMLPHMIPTVSLRCSSYIPILLIRQLRFEEVRLPRAIQTVTEWLFGLGSIWFQSPWFSIWFHLWLIFYSILTIVDQDRFQHLTMRWDIHELTPQNGIPHIYFKKWGNRGDGICLPVFSMFKILLIIKNWKRKYICTYMESLQGTHSVKKTRCYGIIEGIKILYMCK